LVNEAIFGCTVGIDGKFCGIGWLIVFTGGI
jgi:hypothetical protein